MTGAPVTTFYGVPGAGPFWHWPTLLHFSLVALAGGTALLAALRALGWARFPRRLAWLALGLVALDLMLLWAGSAARFRLTHVYLYLAARPTSALWWGAWGLASTALLTLLLALGRGPRRLWGAMLALSATITLVYPGLALAANAARPLWTPLLLAFMPVSGLLLAWGAALPFRQRDLRDPVAGLGLGGAVLGALYLVGLAFGGAAARAGLAELWREGGTAYLAALLAMLLSPLLVRRWPAAGGLLAVAGAVLARSLIVHIGGFMPPAM